MRLKKLGTALLVCIMVFSVTVIPCGAASIPDSDTIISRAFGQLNHSIPKNSIVFIDAEFYLEAGDRVTFNCIYTPKSASLDFGYIAPDGLFYSINCTSGSINKSIEVVNSGQYTLAIRNNANYAVTVTGTVKY